MIKINKFVTNVINYWLLIILILAFSVRLYKIDSPIADWHSWRQADTAAVTRSFIREGFNPLLPRYDDMISVAEKSIPNPARFRFVEFPIYNMAVYPLYLLFGVDEWLHRLVSVMFSLGSIIFLYLITKKYTNTGTALLASLTFAILPFNVFYSRTILPEPTLIFFSLGMIYFVDRWVWEGSRRNWWLGLIFAALAFLIKPWALFFALPLIYSIYRQEGRILPVPKKYIVFALLALLPFLLWRMWILQHPEGIPASAWLLNGDGIRFKPIFWWWILSERIGREILGVSGAILFFIGLLIKPKNGNYFLHIWALSCFLFMIIFATGNVRHNYYQILFVPVASIFLALGVTHLISGISGFLPRFWTILFALFFFSLTFYFGWIPTKEFYKINNPAIVEAGKKADQVLPKEAIVVAPYNGDTAFLYQTNRPGFAIVNLPLPAMVANYGVTHYISVNMDAKTNWVKRHFHILEDNPKYTIVDLTNLKKGFDESDPEPP